MKSHSGRIDSRCVTPQRKLFIGVMRTVTTMETVTIAREEYEKLKKKADIADDALVQLKLSLEDLRHKRVSKFDLKAS